MKKLVFIVLVLAVSLGVIFWFYKSRVPTDTTDPNRPVTLNVWVFKEDESVIGSIAQGYKDISPSVTINLISQTLTNYTTRLEAQIQAEKGPDIYKIHVAQVPQFLALMSQAPGDSFTSQDFKTIFYPIAAERLVIDNQVLAVPESIDGLALFVNNDIISAAGVSIPQTWEQFVEGATKVTVRNTEGLIQTSGAALGTSTNVDYWPEIISLLFLQQPRASLLSPDSSDSAEAIAFYTSFVTDPRKKTWDQTLPTSSQMFAEGKLAFYFGPSKKVYDFKAHNPSLNFSVVSPPKLSASQNVAIGSFWVWAVSGRSKEIDQSWKFLRYLSTTAGLEFTAAYQKSNNLPIKPFPRVDMAQLVKADPKLAAFVDQGPSYRTWFLNSDLKDGGLNEKIFRSYEKVITDTLGGTPPNAALSTATSEIKKTLTEYNVQNFK